MILDLTQNQDLEQLEIRGYDKERLDLSKCDKLWYLDCGSCRMKEIAISNNSVLKEVIFCASSTYVMLLRRATTRQ